MEDGKLHIVRRKDFVKSLVASFKDNARLRITVEQLYKKRSNQQNRFYWGVVIPIVKSLIYDAWGDELTGEEVHEILKQNCNYTERLNESTGEVVKVGKTTTGLTTTEWEEYRLEVTKWVHEWFNTELPEPNEQTELF